LSRRRPLPSIRLEGTTDFWQSPSLEELAVSQGVQPMSDVKKIFGIWPGTDDDGFEEDILALSKTCAKESRS
jgi:hypothetical protein